MSSCTTLSAASPKPQHEKTENDTIDGSKANKKSATALAEPLVECMETRSGLAARKVDQCSSIGGGDAPSIMEGPKSYNDVRRLSDSSEVTPKRLFGD